MPKTSQTTGIIVLSIGVILLLATFIEAYLLLHGFKELSITGDLASAFGSALGPLISATIKAIFLGVMGWVASILTVRGIQLLRPPELKVRAVKETTKKRVTQDEERGEAGSVEE